MFVCWWQWSVERENDPEGIGKAPAEEQSPREGDRVSSGVQMEVLAFIAAWTIPLNKYISRKAESKPRCREVGKFGHETGCIYLQIVTIVSSRIRNTVFMGRRKGEGRKFEKWEDLTMVVLNNERLDWLNKWDKVARQGRGPTWGVWSQIGGERDPWAWLRFFSRPPSGTLVLEWNGQGWHQGWRYAGWEWWKEWNSSWFQGEKEA